MAQERFRLDDGNVTSGNYFAADNGGTDFKLIALADAVGSSAVIGHTTSSWEGSKAAIVSYDTTTLFRNAAGNNLAPAIYYVDYMVFIPSGEIGGVNFPITGNSTTTQYSWAAIRSSGGNYAATIQSYDSVDGTQNRTATITAGPINNWCRVRVFTTAKGIAQIDLFTGAQLPTDTVGGNELVTPTASTTVWGAPSYANWDTMWAFGSIQENNWANGGVRIDDILIDLYSPPTRVPAVTAGTSFAGIVPI